MADNARAVIIYREFETKTGGRLDLLDVTDDVNALVAKAGIRHGSALVFSPHTTCCILTCESGVVTAERLQELMDRLAPPDAYYAHDDLDVRTENLVEDEPPNAPGHLFHVFCGKTSETVPIIDGKVALGDSQRVLFVELDASRLRRYGIQVVGE